MLWFGEYVFLLSDVFLCEQQDVSAVFIVSTHVFPVKSSVYSWSMHGGAVFKEPEAGCGKRATVRARVKTTKKWVCARSSTINLQL